MSIDVVFDMETGDPDDFFTLCLLTAHPKVNLRAVTVTPGTGEQISVVRYALQYTEHDHIPVGSRLPDSDKQCVSEFHRKFLPPIQPQEADGLAYDIIADVIKNFPEVTLLTGAALHNLRLFLNYHPNLQIKRWVAQGGFAGNNVVPPEYRLPKFEGLTCCPTFNFNGDVKGAKQALISPQILRRVLVSKNVCHGLVYDENMHEMLAQVQKKAPGYQLIYRGMNKYLKKNRRGKMFHDPLAACVAVDESICIFREVEVYREQGGWGSKLQNATNTYISVALDREKFLRVFLND